MQRSEFLAYFRVNYPDYADLSDDEVIENATRDPKFSGWLDRPPTQTAPPKQAFDVADRISRLKKEGDSSFLGFIDTWNLDRTAKNFARRGEVATLLVGMEKLEGEAKIAALNTAKAEFLHAMDMAVRESMARNQVEIANKATSEGIPYEKYAEILLEVAKMKVQIEAKKFETELRLHESFTEDKLAVEAALLKNNEVFSLLNQLSDRIAETELQVTKLLESGEQPITLKTRQRELETLTAMYNERLAGLTLQTNGGDK